MSPKKPRVPKNSSTSRVADATRDAQRRQDQREKAVQRGTAGTDTRRGQKLLARRAQERVRQRYSHATPEEQRPARNFSGRMIAVIMVLFLAVVVMAPSLRTMLQQNQEISQAEADLQAEQQRNEELTQQLNRWDDPAYVQQQARERFNMVMPGEHKYLVVGGEELAEGEEPVTEEEEITEDQAPAWADDFWNSFVHASQHQTSQP
ncbi:septum formation initiator family protein [Auritidibacter ignavus]|uniref:FtsB family cell division protein n=1 Tax=Auritidibacter ignavus TaxID=678932 RepID=UPI002FE5F73C